MIAGFLLSIINKAKKIFFFFFLKEQRKNLKN